MPPQSPLAQHHAAEGARFLPYGEGDDAIPVVATFGSVDLEYASLRKGCALFDAPHRATLRITGDDRITFLSNMVTQQLTGIEPGETRSAFWLNRKGRIVADLRLTELGDEMLAEVDALRTATTVESLNAYIIADDVEITDASADHHRLTLLGPAAPGLIEDVTRLTLDPHRAARAEIATATATGPIPVVVERHDTHTEPAFDLIVRPTDALAVSEHLRATAEPPELDPTTGRRAAEPTESQQRHRLRQTGWLAVNIARIESGSPMFGVDFTEANLPAETGLLDQRVDFKKGCYLGQEVVARMFSLGAPKQRLVGLRPADPDVQPVAGAPVTTPDAKPVGSVTSSTISPMLGGVPVCFAMIKNAHADPDTQLLVDVDGSPHQATVAPSLRFWPAP